MFDRPSGRGSCSAISPAQPISVDGRAAGGVGAPRRVEELDAEDPVAGERVREHLAVARLEDVERERRLREEDDAREREDRDPARHFASGTGVPCARPQSERT